MTDRELLELAAKAAGDAGKRVTAYGAVIMEAGYDAEPLYWNPLADDGYALRLAVKLGIDICINHEELEVWADDCREPVIHDAGVATRRAIVRAAASIGEGMP